MKRRDDAGRNRAALLGVGTGALGLICCLAGPLLLGAVAGSLVGGLVEALAVVLLACALVSLVCWWLRRPSAGG